MLLRKDELIWVVELSRHFFVKTTYHAQQVYYFSEEDAKI